MNKKNYVPHENPVHFSRPSCFSSVFIACALLTASCVIPWNTQIDHDTEHGREHTYGKTVADLPRIFIPFIMKMTPNGWLYARKCCTQERTFHSRM